MDIQIFLSLVFFLLAVGLLLYLKKNNAWGFGKIGEFGMVRKYLNKLPGEYHIVNNLLI